VYSELGRGSTFKIYLARADSAASAQKLEHASLAPGNLRGTETVLLVEDSAEVRSLVCAILRRNGYQVLEAQTAGDALMICAQHQGAIHLLFTDVVMPRMSGREPWERLAPLRPTRKC